MFLIFLSNRVHPHGKGNVNRLAGEVGRWWEEPFEGTFVLGRIATPT